MSIGMHFCPFRCLLSDDMRMVVHFFHFHAKLHAWCGNPNYFVRSLSNKVELCVSSFPFMCPSHSFKSLCPVFSCMVLYPSMCYV